MRDSFEPEYCPDMIHLFDVAEGGAPQKTSAGTERKYCPSCGKPLRKGLKFCGSCGAKIS